MNNAALTTAEIHALDDADRSCEDANRQLGHAGAHRDGADASVFEESLRLKNTLDAYEAKATTQPSWETLSLLVNCEYRLYVLNQTTPLRNNPFLSHWVEAIQRLGAPDEAPQEGEEGEEGAAPEAPSTAHISLVRASLLKALLQSRNPSQFARSSPRTLFENYVLLRQTSPFSLRTYVRMLEEEGIYERTPSPPASPCPSLHGGKQGKKEGEEGKQLTDFQRWKHALVERLAVDPANALAELTHLPLELASLDLLTTLLQDGDLPRLGIAPEPVVADFLQGALRALEGMARGTWMEGEAGMESRGSGNGETHMPVERETESQRTRLREADGGMVAAADKDALVRAVRLVLLFLRNAIRKELLPVACVYFEIQEVCVRYVWMREVREFRAWVEDGVEEEKGEG